MEEQILKNYAKLIVRTGANVQKDQRVFVTGNVDDAYFIKHVVKEAYEAGAKEVHVDWNCTEISRMGMEYQSVETLCEFPLWREEKLKYQAKELPAMIHIASSDPDGFKGVDQEKMQKQQMAIGPKIMPIREQMDGKYQWTIAGIPGKAWAKKVFPNVSEDEAMAKLWEAILKVTRVNGDPLKNWDEHNKNLLEKSTKLNNLGVKTLRYKSVTGTDFEVSLKESAQFVAGGETTLQGVYYNPNMPTEECFTSPDKYSANGIVYSTKPLSVRGVLVENFAFRFEGGKVVEVIAKDPTHKEVLEKLISTDEGASRLGEVALVPFNSPINETGLLFYNTLYDENACCHLAIGRAFDECIRNHEKLSEEEIKAVDLNKSMIHVDFMIGSSDLSIIATCFDGKEVEIFKDGVWAI